MSEELKPCPFCGDPKNQDTNSQDIAGRRKHSIYCSACNCEGPLKSTPDEAIAAWNTRATVEGEPAPKGEQPAPAADEMEQYRRTLEVIAVGDAGDPITAAVNTLVATGFWDASAPAPAGDAPADVSDEIERLLDQCLAYQAGVSSAIALEDAQDEADNRRLLAAAKGNLLTAVKAIRHKAIDDAVRVVGLQKGLK